MTPDDELPVWDDDALRAFTTHPARGVRGWACERLGASRATAHVPFLVERLAAAGDDAEAILAALKRIAPAALEAGAVEALAAYEAAQPVDAPTAKLARRLLVSAGDPLAAARLAVRCRAGLADRAEWALLHERDPGRVREIVGELGWADDPSKAPSAALAAIARVCDAEALPRVHDHALRDPRLDQTIVWEVLERAHAERAPLVDETRHTRARACAEELARELAGRRSPADRRLSLRWESVDALRPIADAMVNHRWGEAVAWCRARLDELRRGDDASACARAYAAWLSRQRRPEIEMVQALGSMAFAAVDRALDALKPFDKADPETRAWRAVMACTHDAPARHAWAVAAWADGAERAALAAVVTQGLASDDASLRRGAAALVVRLPGFELPAAAARESPHDDVTLTLIDGLAAQPDSLLRLAREDEARRSPLVYDALARFNRRAASGLLREAIGRLAEADDDLREAVLMAVGDVRDPALLPTLLDASEPDAEGFARALCDLADVAPGEEWASPEVAEVQRLFERIEAGEALDLPARPFVVRFRCDACGAEGRAEAPSCYVRREQAECRAAGWDGISFNRVIRCASCGADDRYTLTPGTRWRALMCVDSPGDGVDLVLGALAAEGVKARRASELLRHFEAAVAASPGDVDALRQLGVAQRLMGEADAARRTFEAALALEATALVTAVMRHAAVADLGDAAQVERSARALLTLLPGAKATDDTRRTAAKQAAAWLRGADVVRVRWREGAAEVTDAVALDRVTKWDRLAEVLREACVVAVEPGGERPPDGGRLERVIEGIAPVADGLQPALAAAARPDPTAAAEQERRFRAAGRNDPCPCGSGKKYKKCHLDAR